MANLSNINNKFLVTTGGNVGIGDTGPSTRLTVDVPAILNNTVNIFQLGDDTNGLVFKKFWNASGIAWRLNKGVSGINMMTFSQDGKVGIGTTSPQRKLHLHESSSSGSFISFTNDTTGQASTDGAIVGIDGGEDMLISIYENKNIEFRTGNTERMRIDSSGNVGIGTASPGATLVLGNATGNVAELRVLRSNSLSTTYGFINTIGGTAQLGGSGDTRIISSTGRLLFNSNSTDQISLEANGEYRLKLGSTTTGYEASMDNSNTAYRIFGSRFGGTGKYVAIWSDGANENTRFYPTKTVFYKNVGIGTNSPGYKLNVINDNTATWTARFTNNTNNVYLSVNDANNYGIYVSGETKNYFSGNVGIGTTSPGAKLDVQSSTTGNLLSRLYNPNAGTSSSASFRIASAASNANSARLEFSDASYYTATISGDRSQGIVFRTSATGSNPITIPERMRIDAKGLVKEIYNEATTTTSNYVRGTTYSWNGSSLSFYWNKIGNVNSSSGACKLVVEVLGFGDNNYPYWQRGIIKVGRYSTGLNISVIRTEGFGGDLIGFDAVVDSNFDVWVKMNNLSWSSYIGFKLLNAEGGATLNTDPISSATLTTPTGTPVVSADRSIRVTTGALSTITHSYEDFYTKIGGSNVFLLGPNENTSFNITNIGNTSPTNPAQLNVKTPGTAQVETGLRLINSYGFSTAGTGSKIVFAQDRSNGENFEMAAIQSSQKTNGTSVNSDLVFSTRNSTLQERFRITFSGNLIAPAVYNLTTSTAANMYVSSTGFFYRSTSSLKYKTDVRNYDKGLNEVMQLQPKYYKGKNDGDTQFAGLIAEDVHDLGLNEFVQYAEDGTPDALAYANMVALLTKAIQELKAEIDELKK